MDDHQVVFLITSMISRANCNRLSDGQRRNETIETIESVHRYVPECVILLIEGSDYIWNTEDLQKIHSNLQVIYHNVLDETKSAGEAILLSNALKSEYFERINKPFVFKLSGRYTLNDNFNKAKFTDATDKITVLKTHVYNPAAPPTTTVVVTVLYSVPYSQIDTYRACLQQAIVKIKNNNYDIEHALFGSVDVSSVNIVNCLGVRGIVASLCTEWSA